MVDYLVVTFIREEYEAVLRQFRDPDDNTVSGVPGDTRVVRVTARSGQGVAVAIARTACEGNVSAQDAVLELITAQQPRLVLAVGIAGAVPTSDVFLGDVVLAKDIHDLTRGAETATGREEAAASSYLMNAVKDFVTNVTTHDFKKWQDWAASIARPEVEGIGNSWTDDEDWDKKINGTLEDNRKRTLPIVVDGVIASSDHLVKSEDFMENRLLVDRRILANDMESAGVAKACERRHVPLLILRAISDIVGHARSDDWKRYACEIVAGCAREVVYLESVDTIESKLKKGEPGLSGATKGIIDSLDDTLVRIRRGVTSEYASACQEAFDRFRELPEKLKRRWAPDLFETLDRPMKYLGDKKLVLDVAKACIECCSGVDLDDRTAECQARARICGTSWVYQRTGNLGLAEQEALKSVRISEGVSSRKNLAFCKKCLGRLKRLRAEAESNPEVKRAFFKDSVQCLEEAISLFRDLDHDREVGDCYSLLGRTYLSKGDIRTASECVEEAMRRIDPDSKDYLDLRILEGDICLAAGEHAKAFEAFGEVIDLSSEQDYQISEIVARAHRQRAWTLMRVGRNAEAEIAFAKAQRIWEYYGEDNFAAEAEWGGILASEILERRTKLLLEAEDSLVRCEAVRLYREEQSKRRPRAVAQRGRADNTVWKNLIKEAKRLQALGSGSD
ncbi:MAG: hypothetical protein OXE42_12010 [Gammaproteobacteria bacterium]|nr:hypothetical protein [Gammaproteobacteria bacterium]